MTHFYSYGGSKMKKSNSTPPQTLMGKVINIDNVAKLSEQEIELIIHNVLNYGVCCIKGQDLSPQKLDVLATLFGTKIVLPEYMAFNNQVDQYKSVVKVSNMAKDGTVIKNYTGAQYWHQDGEFNIGKKRRVWNFLYSQITPAHGGDTGFCDARRVLKILPDELRSFVEEHQISVDPNTIPDFNLDSGNMADKKSATVYHNMVETIKHVPEEVLYMGTINCANILGLKPEESEQVKDELVNFLSREDNLYVHKWTTNDLLIWDNMLVYHKSMGGYGNEKRLLYRAQARMFQ